MTQQNSQNQFKAQIFHALSATERLEILDYLRDGEKCVCEIGPQLNLLQPIVSRHLKILKDAGIIKCRKEATKRLYSIVNPQIYNTIDALNPQVLNALHKQRIEHINCR